MISLEQIRLLEQKVQAAVARIGQLKQENATLKEHLSSYQKRIDELEVLVESFKADQGQIEQGILNALAQLDQLEDEVTNPEPAPAHQPQPETPASSPAESPAGEHSTETPHPSQSGETETAAAYPEPDRPAPESEDDASEEQEDEEDAGPELDIF